MPKPKTEKVVKTVQVVVDGPGAAIVKPKKKKASLKIITLGPVAAGERQSVDVKHIKSGEKLILDTSGKGVLRIGKIVMTGGSVECVKCKDPIELVFRKPSTGAAAAVVEESASVPVTVTN
jgi:hypothetical protein